MAVPQKPASEVDRQDRTPRPDLSEYVMTEWEPDWWSRLVAIGSLLVSAAALYYARLPDPAPRAQAATGDSVVTTDSAGNRNPSDTADPDVDLLAFPGSAAGDSIASADSIAPNSGLDITAIDVAESTAGNTESDVHTLLRPNSQDMPSVESPGDPKGIVASGSPSSQADTAPGLDDSPIRLKGAPASSSKLVLEKVDAHALSSRFAVTMTVRNMGDDLAVISNVAFDPLEVLEDISTEFANLAFESTSPTELALLFQSDDNLAQSADEQGSYTRRLPETVNVPANSSIDIRLAIENSDHVGYGLLGRLTLTYDVEQSVTIEDIAIPFVVDQDTLKDADNDADADADADADNQ